MDTFYTGLDMSIRKALIFPNSAVCCRNGHRVLPLLSHQLNDNTMKTPYMNIKENQGFMIILVIVIAFLMLTSFNGKAQVYTAGINDANYIQPLFAVLLVLANAVHCLRMPYNLMILAGGHYKQTQNNCKYPSSANFHISILPQKSIRKRLFGRLRRLLSFVVFINSVCKSFRSVSKDLR